MNVTTIQQTNRSRPWLGSTAFCQTLKPITLLVPLTVMLPCLTGCFTNIERGGEA
jgi:hypothetical protein